MSAGERELLTRLLGEMPAPNARPQWRVPDWHYAATRTRELISARIAYLATAEREPAFRVRCQVCGGTGRQPLSQMQGPGECLTCRGAGTLPLQGLSGAEREPASSGEGAPHPDGTLHDYSAGWDAAERGRPRDESQPVAWLNGWEYWHTIEERDRLAAQLREAQAAARRECAEMVRRSIGPGGWRVGASSRWPGRPHRARPRRARRVGGRVTKPQRALLERLFAAEVDAAVSGEPLRRLVQANNKTIRQLEEWGYAERVTLNLGGRFPVTISGYTLTLAGNAAYCLLCDGGDEPAASEESCQKS